MPDRRFVLGVDFGTASGRALLSPSLDVPGDGEEEV